MKVMVLNPPSRHSKNVIRDLFYGCWCKGKRIAAARFPPSTLLYIVTVLQNEGHKVTLLDTQADDKDLEDVKSIVQGQKPEAIIIPTSTMTFREDAETMRELKDLVDTTTLAFGSHTTFLPKASLGQGGFDYIVMREPEYIIRDFINSMDKGRDYRKTKGIGFRRGREIVINPPYPFIQNLDELPIPDRKPILKYSYFNPLVKKLPWTTAITSRGCPGRCTFCTSPGFYGNTWRARSPENVVHEMEELSKLGYKEIFFRDETFTANPKRTQEICSLIRERAIDMEWICSARVGTVNKEIMKEMRKAGCHMLRFGVESGDQRILDNINKGIKIDLTRKTFKWANDIGMETHAHTMIGCTGETRETIQKTIKFLKEIDPTTLTMGIFTPYPGTKIFEEVKKVAPEIEDGSECDLSRLHQTGFYNYVFTELSDRELGRALQKAYRSFYLRPGYILKRLRGIKSLDEFRRVVSAGLEVMSFSFGND